MRVLPVNYMIVRRLLLQCALSLPLVLACFSSYAQPSAPRFQRLSVEQGLSQSTISSILRDSQGFMWFGTADGLNRFDGYTFTIYRNNPLDSTSLSDNWIWNLCEDGKGNLWVATQAGGVNRYDRVHDRFVRYTRENGLSGNNVAATGLDSEGILWVGIWGGSVHRYDMGEDKFTRPSQATAPALSFSDPRIRSLLHDSKGLLWVGTWEGLNKIDLATGTIEPLTFDKPGGAGNRIQCLTTDAHGTLWIGTWGDGLKRLDLRTGEVTSYRHDPGSARSLSDNTVTSLAHDERGRLWVGTFRGGLNLFDPATGGAARYQNSLSDPSSLSSNAVLAVYKDVAGTVWVGTDGGGINLYNALRKTFELYPDDFGVRGALSHRLVHCMLEDSRGNLWIGTAGGLDCQRNGEDSLIHFRHSSSARASSLSHNAVLSLCEDRMGALWVGTTTGLDRLDPARSTISHFPLPTERPGQTVTVNALLADSLGNLWVASSEEGLFRIDLKLRTAFRCRTTPEDLPGSGTILLYSLCPSRSGGIYLGSWGAGLFYYDKRSGVTARYYRKASDTSSLHHNIVLAMYEDAAGVLWIGTYGGGLDRFDPMAGTFAHFTEADGLPNNVVYGILPDQTGRLWLSTNRGLACFDTASRTCRNFSMVDGLPSDEFNQGAFAKARNGDMLFGSVNGLVMIRPQENAANHLMPSIVLTSFAIHEQPARLGSAIWSTDRIRLKHEENFFAFEFAALDYVMPARSRYAYILEGMDRDWVECGTRRDARYTNVAPGDYVFRVRGSSIDGVWNTNEASVRIRVDPPFWKTWWFITLCALALIAIGFALYRFRVRQLLEMERLRLRIASDLHDELASNLSTIAMFSRIVEDGVGSGADAQEQRTQLQARITTLAQESVGSIRDIIWALDPKKETLHDLLTRLEDALLPICRAKGITLRFDRPAREELPATNLSPTVRQHLWLLLKESVNNAIKHSDCTALTIVIKRSSSGLQVAVTDNGVGFAAGLPTNGKGLGTMRMRAKWLGGTVEFLPTPGGGATVKADLAV